MKLDKSVVQRRIDLMEAEGVVCNRLMSIVFFFNPIIWFRRSFLTLMSELTSMLKQLKMQTTLLLFALVQHGPAT